MTLSKGTSQMSSDSPNLMAGHGWLVFWGPLCLAVFEGVGGGHTLYVQNSNRGSADLDLC